ncbi:MAG: hypothetical protein MZV64_10270 [Ignavibacteriales bacterium]|nr:hypothetical protein [Ignavibacteriales bacterium]
MPGSAWEVYTELARTFQVELEDGITIDVANAGVMAGKLQQVSQGCLFTDEAGTWTELHTAKLDAVTDLVSELQGEPVLIAYWYRHDLARLQARFPEAPALGSGMSATKLNALVDAWNRGEIPILLLHPAQLCPWPQPPSRRSAPDLAGAPLELGAGPANNRAPLPAGADEAGHGLPDPLRRDHRRAHCPRPGRVPGRPRHPDRRTQG